MKFYNVEYNHMRILESSFYRYNTLFSQISFMFESNMDNYLINQKLQSLEDRWIILELIKQTLIEVYCPNENSYQLNFNFDKNIIEVQNE